MTRATREAFEAVTAAFASLGRVCLALDAQFETRHLSPRLDDLLGEEDLVRERGGWRIKVW